MQCDHCGILFHQHSKKHKCRQWANKKFIVSENTFRCKQCFSLLNISENHDCELTERSHFSKRYNDYVFNKKIKKLSNIRQKKIIKYLKTICYFSNIQTIDEVIISDICSQFKIKPSLQFLNGLGNIKPRIYFKKIPNKYFHVFERNQSIQTIGFTPLRVKLDLQKPTIFPNKNISRKILKSLKNSSYVDYVNVSKANFAEQKQILKIYNSKQPEIIPLKIVKKILVRYYWSGIDVIFDMCPIPYFCEIEGIISKQIITQDDLKYLLDRIFDQKLDYDTDVLKTIKISDYLPRNRGNVEINKAQISQYYAQNCHRLT